VKNKKAHWLVGFYLFEGAIAEYFHWFLWRLRFK